MTESLLSNNASNRFKFIMTLTREKTCGLRRRNQTTLPSPKPRTVDNMLFLMYRGDVKKKRLQRRCFPVKFAKS